MQTLAEWKSSPEFTKIKSGTLGQLFEERFFRDPLRSTYNDPTVMYAPADGIVLYAQTDVGPTDAICNVKGKKFTPQDLLCDYEYRYPSLVVGIFMTQYDVHVNRVPARGYLNKVKATPYLFTPKISMVFEEKDIMEGEPDPRDMAYLFKNERRISEIYCPIIRGNYYIVQVADKDVDEIVNWGEGEFFEQGERFGQIRTGSQVDLLIPLMNRRQFELLVGPNQHVEGGIDAIVRIK